MPDTKAADMLIRPENPADRAAIHWVNTAAFGGVAEADLVDALREQAWPFVSLVAEENGVIVGHIAFTPVTSAARPDARIMGLAPMAVAPERQRCGIGSALVRAGLAECRASGCGAVVVLGHPDYYPRFGFTAAARSGVGCEYDVPTEAFMALELEPGGLAGAAGIVRYHAAFAAL